MVSCSGENSTRGEIEKVESHCSEKAIHLLNAVPFLQTLVLGGQWNKGVVQAMESKRCMHMWPPSVGMLCGHCDLGQIQCQFRYNRMNCSATARTHGHEEEAYC